MNNKKQPEPISHMRQSIANKLKWRLFSQLIGHILSFNLLLILIAGISLMVYCESAMLCALNDPQSAPEVHMRSIEGYTVISRIGWPLNKLLPNETENATRAFSFEGLSFWDGSLYGASRAVYIMNAEYNGGLAELSISVGPFLYYFIHAFSILLLFELMHIISRTVHDHRMVNSALEPITSLSRAAQNLGDAGRRLDHDRAMALAGRLEGIDGSHPDTRIPLDDLHEELRSVAIAINGMLDRIYEAYAAQARFVSDASHELRTPIAVIQGYANLLDRWGKEDEKTLTESISAIKDEAQNMKDMVEQLLFLARGESNAIRLEMEEIRLDEVIGEVVSETRMLDSEHEIKIDAGEITVMADRSLIKQALRILVDNAVKYTDKGGTITVSASKQDNEARICVSDDGMGISPKVLPRVFDRFVRAEESRARATGGAGLGLSIVSFIAARHNGHVEALSREGIGTRMTLVIRGQNNQNPFSSIQSAISPA